MNDGELMKSLVEVDYDEVVQLLIYNWTRHVIELPTIFFRRRVLGSMGSFVGGWMAGPVLYVLVGGGYYPNTLKRGGSAAKLL